MLFLLTYLSKYNLLILLFKWYINFNLILSECLIDNRFVYPSLINFSYKQINHLFECKKKAFFIILSKKRFT